MSRERRRVGNATRVNLLAIFTDREEEEEKESEIELWGSSLLVDRRKEIKQHERKRMKRRGENVERIVTAPPPKY